MESHLKKAVLGIVALTAAGADHVTAPGRSLAVVVIGDSEGDTAAARDEEHLERAFDRSFPVLWWLVRSLTTPEERLRSG